MASDDLAVDHNIDHICHPEAACGGTWRSKRSAVNRLKFGSGTSIWCDSRKPGPVAQRLEPRTHNPSDEGSNPSRPIAIGVAPSSARNPTPTVSRRVPELSW